MCLLSASHRRENRWKDCGFIRKSHFPELRARPAPSTHFSRIRKSTRGAWLPFSHFVYTTWLARVIFFCNCGFFFALENKKKFHLVLSARVRCERVQITVLVSGCLFFIGIFSVIGYRKKQYRRRAIIIIYNHHISIVLYIYYRGENVRIHILNTYIHASDYLFKYAESIATIYVHILDNHNKR